MENNIQKILEDLYNIDESFKAHEDKLIKLITKLLHAKPDTKLDDEFVAKLRRELMAEAEGLGQAKQKGAGILNFMNLNKFTYVVMGAAITLILIVPSVIFMTRTNKGVEIAKLDLGSQAKIARVENNAFGFLVAPGDSQEVAPQADGQGAATLNQAESSVPAMEAKGIGGGGGGLPNAVDSRIAMPVPGYLVDYQFEYVGDELNLIDENIPVYKRMDDNNLGRNFSSLIKGFDLGLLDLDKFRNTELTTLNFSEDREYGYTVYFNFTNNSVSLSMNWEKWPRPEQDCRDEACFERYRTKPSDVPADDAIINIADAFLKEYGIDRIIYGQPKINDYWKRNQETLEGGPVYIPESIPVVYPLLLDGQEARGENGEPRGMTVEVNIRYNKVAGVNELYLANYASSNYAAITDAAKVVEIAEDGGMWPNRGYYEADKTVTLKLGTPEKGLVHHWQYSANGGKGGNELYVTALIFPIINLAELDQPYYNTHIVVPLAQEILDSRIEPPIGIPEPMPLMRVDESAIPAISDTEETMEVQSVEIGQ